MRTEHSLSALLGLALLAGCVTNPQPVPIPLTPPDPEAVFVSNPGETRSAVTTGLPGAVDAAEDVEVVVSALPSGQQGRGPAFTDGSFSLQLMIAAGDHLEAWTERDTERSERVALPYDDLVPNDAVLVIQSISPVQDGTTTVIGRGDGGDTIVLGNRRNGAAASVTADATGIFTARLAAAAGDLLALFSIDATTKVAGTAVEATVPGP